ncbi:MAG TPA: hypothetical protein ENN21_08905 [Spirochaetes bacterium]|nr:hypothetical protein [Spirochaetota bacterium]
MKVSWALLLVPLMLSHCAQRGPLTPEEAFHALSRAYHRGDSVALLRLLSRDSLDKVNHAAGMFARMSNEQREIIAGRLEVDPDRLKTLTPAQYLDLQFKLGRRLEEDSVREATSLKIVGSRVEKARAAVRVANGMELFFVKEGPYWKFDMTKF